MFDFDSLNVNHNKNYLLIIGYALPPQDVGRRVLGNELRQGVHQLLIYIQTALKS